MKSPTDLEPSASPRLGGKKYRPVIAADLFCGAGGTSAGLVDACRELNLKVELTAINHWDIAVASHTLNHPAARHLCASLDALNPRSLYKEGELKILWASPECTHHSVARGGKPIKDQSRATAWCVIRWAEALLPDIILVENVKEFRSWGALVRKRVTSLYKPTFDEFCERERLWKKKRTARQLLILEEKLWQRWEKIKPVTRTRLEWQPDPKRKGEIYQSWKRNLEAIGYRVDDRVLCAADYGDPTTRARLFVMAVRKKYKIVWPDPTHAETPTRDLFGGKRKPWVAARSIIDWTHKGNSIFDRKKPLADNTLRRIFIGLERFGFGDLIVGQQSDAAARPTSQPAPTVATAGAIGLAKPCLVKMRGTGKVADIDAPTPTVTAGGNHLGVMESCLVQVNHGKSKSKHDDRSHSLKKPMPAVTTKRGMGLVNPVLVEVNHGHGGKDDSHRARSVDRPIGSVTGSKGLGVAEFILQTDQTGGNGAYVRSTRKPLNTVVTKSNLAVIESKLKPFILPHEGVHKKNAPRSLDKPLPTVTASHGAGRLVEPFIVPTNFGERKGQQPRAHDIKKPLPTVVGSNTHGLAEPFIIPQFGSQGPRSVKRPLGTLTTQSRGVGLAQPCLVKFYGTGAAVSVDKPLDSVTTKERFGLAEFFLQQTKLGHRPVVEINGEKFHLEILFRMLQWRELASAQGFRKGYRFTGNTEAKVKQIGNAVPRNLARAIVRAVLSQNPNVNH